jgi:hypothetical protein
MSDFHGSSDSDWDHFISRCQQALGDLVEGRPEPFKALWSHADDVMIIGPFGGYERGWEQEPGCVIVADALVEDEFTAPAPIQEQYHYAWSVVACLPSVMGDPYAADTGAVMRPATLRRYTLEAGFRDLEVLPVRAGNAALVPTDTMTGAEPPAVQPPEGHLARYTNGTRRSPSSAQPGRHPDTLRPAYRSADTRSQGSAPWRAAPAESLARAQGLHASLEGGDRLGALAAGQCTDHRRLAMTLNGQAHQQVAHRCKHLGRKLGRADAGA